jgi:1,2-diacylglycerol 3-alpha-glucosyltransferase
MIKVFLICSGLGRIDRGFKSFTQECFDALFGEPGLEVTLFKGGGIADASQVALRNLPAHHGEIDGI